MWLACSTGLAVWITFTCGGRKAERGWAAGDQRPTDVLHRPLQWPWARPGQPEAAARTGYSCSPRSMPRSGDHSASVSAWDFGDTAARGTALCHPAFFPGSYSSAQGKCLCQGCEAWAVPKGTVGAEDGKRTYGSLLTGTGPQCRWRCSGAVGISGQDELLLSGTVARVRALAGGGPRTPPSLIGRPQPAAQTSGSLAVFWGQRASGLSQEKTPPAHSPTPRLPRLWLGHVMGIWSLQSVHF